MCNYCGSRETYFYNRANVLPVYQTAFNNTWVNPYVVTGIDFNSKLGWLDLNKFLMEMPPVETKIPMYGFTLSGEKYTAPKRGEMQYSDIAPYIVHSAGGTPKFIDLEEPISSTDSSPIIPHNEDNVIYAGYESGHMYLQQLIGHLVSLGSVS